MERSRSGDWFSHPYLLTVAGCLLLLAVFPAGSADTFLSALQAQLTAAVFAAAAAVSAFAAFRAGRAQGGGRSAVPWLAGAGVCCAVLAALAVLRIAQARNQAEWLCAAFLAALLAAGIALRREKLLDDRGICVLFGIAAFALRALYILYTLYGARQHDVYALTESYGHQAYILYLADHNFALPDFNPYTVWQFYHPPLHYLIAAAWVKLQFAFGATRAAALENVQLLTLFYSCAATVLCCRILRELKFRGAALCTAFAVICFHPYLILLSGSINNDMLCMALTFGAILYALRWNREPTLKNILILAVFIGGSMMAKTSGALVAPAVALLFLVQLVRGRGRRGRLIGQFAAFLAVCAPLGLWWSAWCLLRWGETPGSIMTVSTDSAQYLKGYSVLTRLFGIDWQHLNVFENWDWTNRVFEYNPFVAIFKGSLFDEYTLAKGGPALFLCELLFAVNAALIVFSLVCAVRCVRCSVRDGRAFLPVLFFTLLELTYLGSYVMFCFSEPFACTQNFRYILPTVLFGCLAVSFCLPGSPAAGSFAERGLRRRGRFAAGLTGSFCALSAAVYILFGALQASLPA